MVPHSYQSIETLELWELPRLQDWILDWIRVHDICLRVRCVLIFFRLIVLFLCCVVLSLAPPLCSRTSCAILQSLDVQQCKGLSTAAIEELRKAKPWMTLQANKAPLVMEELRARLAERAQSAPSVLTDTANAPAPPPHKSTRKQLPQAALAAAIAKKRGLGRDESEVQGGPHWHD